MLAARNAYGVKAIHTMPDVSISNRWTGRGSNVVLSLDLSFSRLFSSFFRLLGSFASDCSLNSHHCSSSASACFILCLPSGWLYNHFLTLSDRHLYVGGCNGLSNCCLVGSVEYPDGLFTNISPDRVGSSISYSFAIIVEAFLLYDCCSIDHSLSPPS